MITKNAAGMMFLAAFLFAAPVSAKSYHMQGIFYTSCPGTAQPGVIIDLIDHMRLYILQPVLKGDDVYRTKGEVMEGNEETLRIAQCDAKMENCKTFEGLITMHSADSESAEATIEYFDGTETQGDAESVQGTTFYFKATRANNPVIPDCH